MAPATAVHVELRRGRAGDRGERPGRRAPGRSCCSGSTASPAAPQAILWRLNAAKIAAACGVPLARLPSSSSIVRSFVNHERRGAAVRVGERAVVGVAARAQARLVPELVGELPRGRLVEPRGGQVADGEIPQRLGRDVAPRSALPCRTARAPPRAAGRDEARRRRRGVARVLVPVQVADAGAVQAGVAVAAAVARTGGSRGRCTRRAST